MIESMIEPLLKDTPDKVDPNDPSIYVSDYLEFVKALGFMAGLSGICSNRQKRYCRTYRN